MLKPLIIIASAISFPAIAMAQLPSPPDTAQYQAGISQLAQELAQQQQREISDNYQIGLDNGKIKELQDQLAAANAQIADLKAVKPASPAKPAYVPPKASVTKH